MQLQVIVSIGTMLAVRTGESPWMTVVMGVDVGCEVGSPREGLGTEWA